MQNFAQVYPSFAPVYRHSCRHHTPLALAQVPPGQVHGNKNPPEGRVKWWFIVIIIF
ncbi:MAG: hypothetical protein J7L25_11440 [Deltaproteobacteria bacterium]|nr:hypothetical protein [Candidatus Tharpella aukensis]